MVMVLRSWRGAAVNQGSTKDLYDILDGFTDAMLVTQRRDGVLRARPMAIADRSTTGALWFFTSVDSPKLDELTENPLVNVTMQDGKRFVSISGTSRATRDPDLIRRLWTEGQRIWFEKGRDDPALVALEIVPIYGEYWDRAGVNRIQFFLAEANALLTGSTLSDEGPGHAKIDFGE
jgi:general stress protein 26